MDLSRVALFPHYAVDVIKHKSNLKGPKEVEVENLGKKHKKDEEATINPLVFRRVLKAQKVFKQMDECALARADFLNFFPENYFK